MDHRPQELVVLTLEGLVLEWASGSSGGLAYSQFGARLRDLQVRPRLGLHGQEGGVRLPGSQVAPVDACLPT